MNVGPEPGANSLLFSRYLLTQTGFQCWWAEERAWDHCEDTSASSHPQSFSLWALSVFELVFTCYLWWIVISITANITNKGAHHGLLWCPAPLGNSAWLRKSFQKEKSQSMHLSLKPVQTIFHWQTQEFSSFSPDMWQMLQLNTSQAEFDTERLAKDLQLRQKEKLSTGKRQLQKEDGSFMSSQPHLQTPLECLPEGQFVRHNKPTFGKALQRQSGHPKWRMFFQRDFSWIKTKRLS